MHDALRDRARQKAGRHREPSAAVIVSQTSRATGAGGPGRGFDAGKKTFGRKRHLLVDVSGLVLLAHVHAASIHDTAGARQMVEAAPPGDLPRLEQVWADGAYTGSFAAWLGEATGRLPLRLAGNDPTVDLILAAPLPAAQRHLSPAQGRGRQAHQEGVQVISHRLLSHRHR
jgi:hypothetical protein